jgi:hypothetical protein
MTQAGGTTFRSNILDSAVNATAGKPVCDPNAPCQPCNRTDLQLLVVTPTVVPAAHVNALKSAGYMWNPGFDAAFGETKREATVPVARVARQGYIFVYYLHRQRWDVWQVMHNSLTRKIMHQVSREQYAARQPAFLTAPDPKGCSRGAANLPAQLISIHGAQTTDAVWLAFSPRLWSAATLQRFAANPQVDVPGPASKKKLRELRGREISPAGLLKGQLPTGCLPLNQTALERHVADFCATSANPDVTRETPSLAWPSPGFRQAFAWLSQGLDPVRFGKAAAFDQTVRALERSLAPPGNSDLYRDMTTILMLPDAEGVADAHNEIRVRTLSQRQAWMAGGPDATGKNADPNRPWERQSLLHAGYIREWVKEKERSKHKKLLDLGVYR